MEGPGSSFAELPVFDGGNYPAATSAMENAEVLFISRKDFQGFCREHPEVGLKVIAVVGSRLRRFVGIIEELSFTTVRQRLIALLLKQAGAERYGEISEQWTLPKYQFPQKGQILRALNRVTIACEECSPPEWPVKD